MRHLLLILALAMSAGPLGAAPLRYDCTIASHTRLGWIMPAMTIHLDPETMKAEVRDALTTRFAGGAVPATLALAGQGAWRLVWVLENVPLASWNRRIRAEYRAILDPTDGRVAITVFVPAQDDALPRGSGTCRVRR